MTEDNVGKNKLRLSIDLRLMVVILLVVIAAMLITWKPWAQTVSQDARTISVTGESTIKSEPDEFVFYPSYEFKNSDKTTALNELTKKSAEVISALKGLGVKDSEIKSNTSNNNYVYYYDATTNTNTYTLQLTITVNAKSLSQEIEDYLVTTTPSGQISPQASFSDSKRKQLESTARDEATKEARSKADQSAKNLGFKVGKVKSVQDGSGFGQIYPLNAGATTMDVSSGVASSPPLSVQPGVNDLNYSVTVVYYLK
jgi:uncharacterized protein